MSVGFWMNLAVILISISFAVAVAFIERVKRKALLVHFVFCTIRIALCAAKIPISANASYASAMQYWLPSGSHLLQQDDADHLEVVDLAFSNLMKISHSNFFIILGYVEMGNIWMFLAMMGLNVYTLVGFALLLAVAVPSVLLVPYTTSLALVDTICVVLTYTVTYVSLAVIIERIQRSRALVQDRLVGEMRAAQTADSVLNHSLKNTMADVAGHIETFCGGSAPRSTLEDALACLRRGMRICKERQVFLQLAAGEYRPMRNVVSLRELGEQLVAGRDVAGRFLDLTVPLDSALFSLILDNALNNAFKHGHPGDPHVEFDIAEVPPSRADLRRIQFSVRNVANPDAEPLTPDFLDDLLSGRFLPKREVPILSNGIGFSHALMAAKLAGATIDLQQQGSVVTFTAWVEVNEPNVHPCVLDIPDPGSSSSSAQHFPRGLRFFVLDDSNIARRYLQFLITSWCDPSVVRCFGAQESDVGDFLNHALEGADVVIVDQHLEYDKAYLGTDIVERLLCLGFKGFICMRSAADSAEHQQKYFKHGAHCCFSKDLQGAQFMTELKEAFVEYRRSPTPKELPTEEEWALPLPQGPLPHPQPGAGFCDRFTNLRPTATVHPV
eukprot:EG_transcript_3966